MKNKKTVKIEYVHSGSEIEDFERYLDSLGPVKEDDLFDDKEEVFDV